MELRGCEDGHQHATNGTPMPVAVTPEQAHKRRAERMEVVKEALTERRRVSRIEVKLQRRQGTRPRKERAARKLKVITANCNCVERVKEEILSGVVFKTADLLLVQEHKLKGEQVVMMEQWCIKNNWDCIAADAYIKEVDKGGGTAVLAQCEGLRRTAAAETGAMMGRLLLTVVDYGGEIVVGTIYGISGQPASVQLPIWRELVQRLGRLDDHL